MSIARALAVNYLVIVPLSPEVDQRRIFKLAYDEPPEDGFRGQLSRNPFRAFARDVAGAFLGLQIDASRRTSPRKERFKRAAGFVPDGRVVAAPAAGYGSSYHLEFVAPSGLNITRGYLRSVDAPSEPLGRSAVRASRQRLHLYRSGGGEAGYGSNFFASVDLRPMAATLVRAGALLALFTTALLLFVVFRWETMVENSGSLPSLLLVVPAGLAAFIARPGEASITTGLLIGIRLASSLVGLCAFVAAAILVGGHSCTKQGVSKTCENWAAIPTVLVIVTAVSGVAAFILCIAWFCAERPPEQIAKI